MSHNFQDVYLSSDPFNIRLILDLVFFKNLYRNLFACQCVCAQANFAKSSLTKWPTFEIYLNDTLLTYYVVPDLSVLGLLLLGAVGVGRLATSLLLLSYIMVNKTYLRGGVRWLGLRRSRWRPILTLDQRRALWGLVRGGGGDDAWLGRGDRGGGCGVRRRLSIIAVILSIVPHEIYNLCIIPILF